jgi:cold shock CspA family protein
VHGPRREDETDRGNLDDPDDEHEEHTVAQGTIKQWDEQTRTGSLLMDDRSEVAIDTVSIDGSNIRTLRLGQRVRFDLSDAGGMALARDLRLVTFE